jgi:hypothetical protein
MELVVEKKEQIGATTCAVRPLFDKSIQNIQVETYHLDQLLTYKQASLRFGISITMLKEWKAKGILAFVLVGKNGVRFRYGEICRLIQERETRINRRTRRAS